ncbi:hypothetical protein KCU90_g3022, partial [Aureobasidium melanogenum]
MARQARLEQTEQPHNDEIQEQIDQRGADEYFRRAVCLLNDLLRDTGHFPHGDETCQRGGFDEQHGLGGRAEEQPERGRHGRDQLPQRIEQEIEVEVHDVRSSSVASEVALEGSAHARFRAVEDPVRDAGHQQIQRAAHHEEREVLVCRTRRHLAHAQQFGEPRDGNQRRVFQAQLPDIADARQRETQHLRNQNAARHGHGGHADRTRRFELAARYREHRRAVHLGLIRAGNHADSERADHERRHPDKAVRAEPLTHRGDERRAAEIEQIDDEQFRDATKHRGVRIANHAQRAKPRQLGRRDQRAEYGADRERCQRERDRHQCREQQHAAPALRPEAEHPYQSHSLPLIHCDGSNPWACPVSSHRAGRYF